MNTRPSRSRAHQLRRTLSQRDKELLRELARVRLLHARQIERLLFVEGTDLSRSRRARRTLQRLHEAGLITRMDRRIGGVHAGSSGYIYALGSIGQRVIEAPGPAGGTRRRRPWEPSAMFQDHILAVAETYVQLTEQCRSDPNAELMSFVAEPGCWRTFRSPINDRDVLKPDAYIEVGIGNFVQVTFLEIDLGTEHAPALRRKLGVYQRAFRSGVEQGNGNSFPNVLWVMSSDRRRQLLLSEVARLPPPDCDLFTVTTPQHQLTLLKGGQP